MTIDFPILNLLGFFSYTTFCAAFLYSSTIREQYAYRHPASPIPTVRFNDLTFAVHAVILCIITFSQFFPAVWGFKVGIRQRPSRPALGIFWGCITGVVLITFFVVRETAAGGSDPSGWAWIDVVCNFLLKLKRRAAHCQTDIRRQLCQARRHSGQIHPAGMAEL